MINFVMSIFGAIILIAMGVVIGFWLNVALEPSLPNGFVECEKPCGASFADLERWVRGKK